MELDSFPSPRYRKEYKAESTYADGYVDRQLPIQSVRIEIGSIHQHYRSRGYEAYDHRPQTGKLAYVADGSPHVYFRKRESDRV